jgi:hypothetical protein
MAIQKTPKGYLNNPHLKQVGESIQFTQDQILEYEKCSKDPIYFLEVYGRIISLDDGVVPFKLFGYQKELILSFHENRKTVGKLPRQMGKCHEGDTKYTIRNKKTGEIMEISAAEFHSMVKRDSDVV